MSKFSALRVSEHQPHELNVEYIQRHLRHEDLYEMHASGMTPDQLPFVVKCASVIGEAWVLFWDGKPVFVWGVMSHVPGLYGLFGFGTPDTKRAMPSITRWGMKTWLPDFLARSNARRIEVRVPASSVHSINWLKRLGMVPECTLPRYSVVGEDFLQLALTVGQPHVHTGTFRHQGTHAPASRSSAH